MYGKSNEELEKEWLLYIGENFSDFTIEEKMKIPNFYDMDSAMNSINPEVIQRNN
jgi:hypothetical protein